MGIIKNIIFSMSQNFNCNKSNYKLSADASEFSPNKNTIKTPEFVNNKDSNEYNFEQTENNDLNYPS